MLGYFYRFTGFSIMRPEVLLLILACQFGLSIQACQECACCNDGESVCSSSKKCTNGCIDGYYGDKCTYECLGNCKTCVNGSACIKCKPGYYDYNCKIPCGKGCVNNTCTILGGNCTCKSADYMISICQACLGNRYGDECNNTCPSNCGACLLGTECSWCTNTLYYGSFCQYRCSQGCNPGKCNKTTGHCFSGCKSGYNGDKCDTCSPGFYGNFCDLHCTEKCSTCISKTNCTECKEGYYGDTCTQPCPSGCRENYSSSNGRCLDCKPGFYGEFCNSTCKDGTFGYNCSKFCKNTNTNCQKCFGNKFGIYSGCTKCNSGYYPVTPFGLNDSICKNVQIIVKTINAINQDNVQTDV